MIWTLAAPPVPKSVEDNRVYIYVFVGVAIAALLIAFATKNVPAVRKIWDSWTSARRRATKAARSAQVEDLKQQVAHLTTRVEQLEAEAQADRDQDAVHREWDWQATDEILAHRSGQPPAQRVTLPPPPLTPKAKS